MPVQLLLTEIGWKVSGFSGDAFVAAVYDRRWRVVKSSTVADRRYSD